MSNPRPIKLKIDVSKILKDHLFKGSKSTYLDCVVWPNKDGAGTYGDTHYIVQELSRQARDAGERGPIIGNATVPEVERPIQRDERPVYKPSAQKDAGPTRPIADDMGDENIPF